jgi:hypothetical protein
MIVFVLNPIAVQIFPPSAAEESRLAGSELGSTADQQLKLTVHR